MSARPRKDKIAARTAKILRKQPAYRKQGRRTLQTSGRLPVLYVEVPNMHDTIKPWHNPIIKVLLNVRTEKVTVAGKFKARRDPKVAPRNVQLAQAAAREAFYVGKWEKRELLKALAKGKESANGV